jgi:hypothetical protein
MFFAMPSIVFYILSISFLETLDFFLLILEDFDETDDTDD